MPFRDSVTELFKQRRMVSEKILLQFQLKQDEKE